MRVTLGRSASLVRLTVIWIFGFVLRYFVLLPARSCILVVGVSNLYGARLTEAYASQFHQLVYLFIMTALTGLVPWDPLRRKIYEWAALTCFRILSRSFSAVVSFHNKQFRPKSDGICVVSDNVMDVWPLLHSVNRKRKHL